MARRQYWPGDKVRVRDDLRRSSAHGNMLGYSGEIVTILRLAGTDSYLIEELPMTNYRWTDDMFIGLAGS